MSTNRPGLTSLEWRPSQQSTNGVIVGQVILSFIITAFLSLLLSLLAILSDRRPPSLYTTIVRKLLAAYSDQQLATGLGIQSVALVRATRTVPYHFFLVWCLSLLSTAVHNATLLALVRDFRRDWVLRWLRQGLMGLNLALGCVCGIFVLRGVARGMEQSTLPVSCVWDPSAPAAEGPGAGAMGASFVGTIAAIAGNVLVFAAATWYLHRRSTRRWHRLVQFVGLALMAASAVGAAVRVVLLSQAFGTPSVPLEDRGETVWSFGQLLGVLFLALPVVSVIEIARGEVKVKPPLSDDEHDLLDDKLPLQQRPPRIYDEFQPNPFFGSETNLFKK